MINFFKEEKISSLGGIEPPTFRLTTECATDYVTETLYSTRLRNHVKYQYTIRFFSEIISLNVKISKNFPVYL